MRTYRFEYFTDSYSYSYSYSVHYNFWKNSSRKANAAQQSKMVSKMDKTKIPVMAQLWLGGTKKISVSQKNTKHYA